MSSHSITYLSMDSERSIVDELALAWDGSKYSATASRCHVWQAGDLSGLSGKALTEIVAQKPAQRFNRRAWVKFADQYRDQWLAGKFDDHLNDREVSEWGE